MPGPVDAAAPESARTPPAPPNQAARSRALRVRRILGFVIAAAMIVGAVVLIRHDPAALSRSREALASHPWWLYVVALSLPACNLFLTACTFRVLIKPDESGRPRVGMGEMFAVMAAANAANYLPLRAGLVARAAYHTSVNRIPVAETATIVGVAISLTAAALAYIQAAAVLLAALSLQRAPWAVAGAAILPIPVALLIGFASRPSARRRWSFGFCFRYLDMLAWVARYALCFWLVGTTLTPTEAAAITFVAQAAMLIPFVGNGLGIREWAIGLAAPVLPHWLAGGPVVARVDTGLAADLVSRGLELAVNIPAGIAGSLWIARRLGASSPPEPHNPTPTPGVHTSDAPA